MNNFNNNGMYLEEIINITNNKYNDEDLCVVAKINAGVNVLKSESSKISKVTFKENYNCDYIGIFKGIYFEFEAKQTSKEYFDANQIRKHQWRKMMAVSKHFGISFIIVYFDFYEEFILIDFDKIEKYLANNSKKIPFTWIKEHGFNLKITNELKLDYLKFFPYLKNWN